MSNKTKNILANNQTFETNSEYLEQESIEEVKQESIEEVEQESIEEVEQKKDSLFLLTNINACLFLLTKEYLETDNNFQLFIDNKEIIQIDLSKENHHAGLLNINQIWDSKFDDSTKCWKSTRKNTDFTLGIDVSEDWALQHSHTAYLYQESAQTSEKVTLIYHDPIIGDLLPVQVGENYAIGGGFACHRCDAALVVEFYDSHNEKVQEREFSISSEKLKGGKNLGDYLHIADSVCIPEGVDFIRVVLIKLPTKIDSTPNNSFFFFTHLFFTLTGNNCESEWSNNPFSYEDWLQFRAIKLENTIQITLPLPNDVFDSEEHIIEVKSTAIELQELVLSTNFYAQHSIYHWERFQLRLNEYLTSKNWKNAAKLLVGWFNKNPQDVQSTGIQMFGHENSGKQSIFGAATIDSLQVIRGLTELAPENIYAWKCLTEVNYQLKRWQECLTAFDSLAKLSDLEEAEYEQWAFALTKLYRYEDVFHVYLRSWTANYANSCLDNLLKAINVCNELQLSTDEIALLCTANRKNKKAARKLMLMIIPKLSLQTLDKFLQQLTDAYSLTIEVLVSSLEQAETTHNWSVALKLLEALEAANMLTPLPDWIAVECLWIKVQLENSTLNNKDDLARLGRLPFWQTVIEFDQEFPLLDQNYLRYGQLWKQPPQTSITLLSQFLAQPESKYLSPHLLFDAVWYKDYAEVNKNDRHALVGFFRRSSGDPAKLPRPNSYFDCDWYKEHYLDNESQHPLLHYLTHFQEKSIQPNYYFNNDYVREIQCLLEDEEPLSYYLEQLKSGATEFRLNGFSPSPFFDRKFYLEHNKDIISAVEKGLDPFGHFINHGVKEGRQAYAWQRYNEFVRHQRFYLEPYNWHCHFGLENSLRYIKGERAEVTYFAGQHELVEGLAYQPLVSVLVPVYQVNPRFLEEMIQSVIAQTYPNWQLCLVDDGSKRHRDEIIELFEKYSAKDSRIVFALREENGHICHTSNDCLTLAQGEYVALLDHDDLFTADALYEIVSALNKNPKLDIIYSDEDKVDEWGMFYQPYYKPDWSPHSLWARMYVCHLTVYRKSLVDSVNGFRVGFEGSQDYDLLLRCSEKSHHIHHVQRVLYHWRSHSESTAGAGSNAKDYCADAGYRAVSESFSRRGLETEMGLIDEGRTAVWVKPKVIGVPLIDIIIPCRNGAEILETCLRSIFDKTTYKNFKITVVDNDSDEKEFFELVEYWKKQEPSRFHVIRDESPFNFSAINNSAVHQTTGDYLLFLNNDTEVITEDWLEGMLGYAQLEEVGAVGCKLYYYDDTVQHAGVVTGLGGIAGHAMKHSERNSPGYFWNLKMTTNYSVVTAACLMIGREKFNAVNGFTEYLQVAFNDVDFCLKVREQNLYNVYLPFVELYHYESKSRGYEDTPKKQERFEKEIVFMRQRWGKVLDNDPFYSPWLKVDREDMGYRFH